MHIEQDKDWNVCFCNLNSMIEIWNQKNTFFNESHVHMCLCDN